MDSINRRDEIIQAIAKSAKPLSATSLAKQLHVSRQSIVGDVALLRASGTKIIATPRGYILEDTSKEGIQHTIAVTHTEADLADEIYTIVDMGGQLIDVIVEHPLYGQLCGKLHIASRFDADQFLKKTDELQAKPLSNLTAGLHLHTIYCKDEECLNRILLALDEKGFLYKS